MIDATIERIEQRIRGASTLDAAQREDLLALLATLRGEITTLARTEAGRAESITGFMDVSTHEAVRADASPRLRELSLDGLLSSVEGFETSHPQLVERVNAIANALSGLGI